MNKSVILGLGILSILMVLSVSGCIDSDEYNVTENNGTYLATLTEAEVLESVGPSPSDAPYYTVIDYGMKFIDGQTVFYSVYTDNEANTTNGMVYFKKSGMWHEIDWVDQPGNPNKKRIDSEIAQIIKKTY